MGEKVSRISFRVDGIAGVGTAVDQLSRIMRGQRIEMERAEKVAAQRTAGFVGGKIGQEDYLKGQKEDAAKINEIKERMLKIQQDVQFRADNTAAENSLRIQKESAARALQGFKGDVGAEGAIKTASAMAVAEITNKQAAEQAKAAAMADKLAEKNYVSTGTNRIKFVEAREKAEMKAILAKQKAEEAADKEWIAHEMRKIKLVNARNAAEQKAAGMAGGAGGAGGMSGRWQPSAYQTPAFGSMSDRFTAMFTVGQMMADITGDKSGAREIAGAASGFLLGSLPFGAINAVGIGVGGVFRSIREHTQAANKATTEYGNTLVGLQDRWSSLVTSAISRNSFGKAMESEMERASAAMLKFQGTITTMRAEVGPWDKYAHAWKQSAIDIAFWFGGAGGTASGGPFAAANINEKMAGLESGARGTAQAFEKAAYKQQLIDEDKILKIEKELYTIQAQRPGMLRSTQELMKQIELSSAKLNISQAEQTAKANASLEVTKNMAAAARKLADDEAKDSKYKDYLNLMADEADRKYREARDAAEKLPRQQRIEERRLDRENAAKVRADESNRKKALEDAAYRVQEAQIRAETTGYQQRIDLQDLAFQREEIEAKVHGDKMVQLVIDTHASIRAADRRANEDRIQSIMASFDPQSATGELLRNIKEAGAGGTAGQKAAIDRQMTVGNYRRELEEDMLQLAVKRGTISQRNADVQRMMMADQVAQDMKSEKGRQRRAYIESVADVREALRQQGSRMDSGEFSTRYRAGYVNFAALNLDRQFSPQAHAQRLEMLLSQAVSVLGRMEGKIGLN